MRWEDDCERYEGKDLKGCGRGLFRHNTGGETSYNKATVV